METKSKLEPIVEKLKASSDVEHVFGKPFEAYGKTYVPVATVRYGFGGDGDVSEASGPAGMGGGVRMKAAGVLEISREGTRFIHFEPSWRGIAAIGLGVWMLKRLISGLRR